MVMIISELNHQKYKCKSMVIATIHCEKFS